MRPFLALLALLAAPLTILQACSESSPSSNERDAAPAGELARDANRDARQEDPGTVCPNQRREDVDGRTLIVCDEGFTEPPYLHLPESTSEGPSQLVFGAIDRYGTVLRTGNGATYPLPQEMARAETTAASSHEYQSDHVYRATVTGGNVTHLERFAKIADSVFSHGWTGRIFEGKIAKRAATAGTFEVDPTVPVRIRMTEVREGLPPGWNSYENGVFVPLAPYKPVHAIAIIENVTEGVMSASGACLAPLSDLGASNPNLGAEVQFVRVPSMHSPLSNTVVVRFDSPTPIPTNMAQALWIGPPNAISSAHVLPAEFNAVPHGAPQYGIRLVANAVTGGGGRCAIP